MEDIQLKWTAKTPNVECRSDGYIRIEGQSIPENAFEFYEPINRWVDEYAKSCDGPLAVAISLDYYNSSTSKCLLTFLKKLTELWDDGRKVSVVWFYAVDDEDMHEEIKTYQTIVRVPIRMEPYEG